MTKNLKMFLQGFAIAAMLALVPQAEASKIQKQGIVGTSDCTSRGIANSACLPDDNQIYVNANGINSTLNSAITAGQIGGSGGGGVQLLSNPGFEVGSTGNPPASWSLSAATGSISTANIYAGSQSELLTLSAQTPVLSQDVTPTQPLSGVAMEASCKVLTTQTTVQVCARNAGASLGSAYCTAVPATGTWQYVPANFSGPASGSVGVQVTTSGSTTGTIYVDDCYVGPARNLTQVSQSQLLGQVKITGCATEWTFSGTSYGSAGTVSGCTYIASGSALAPTTNLLAIRFPSLPAGQLTIHYEGSIQQNTQGKSAFFQFTDGTNVAKEESGIFAGTTSGSGGTVQPGFTQTINYPNGVSSAVQLEVFGRTDSGGSGKVYGQTAQPGVISVYYSPSQSQLAINPNQGAALATANNIAGGSYTGGATFPWTNVQYDNYGGFSGGIYTVKHAGWYEISSTIYNTHLNGNDCQTFQNATDLHHAYLSASSVTGSLVTTPQLVYAAVGDTFKQTCSQTMTLDAASTEYRIVIREVTPSQQAPVLIGSVTSSSLSPERVERATVGTSCTTGTCAMSSNTPGISSITRSATGKYSINFSTPFSSATEFCSITNLNDGAGNTCQGFGFASVTASSFPVFCFTASTNAPADSDFTVQCQGPH